MENEESYFMISGLQHFLFCRRQWALIHIEQKWEENVLTVQGKHLHTRADNPFQSEKRKQVYTVRSMPIKSHILSLTGICDIVEFIQDDKGIWIPKLEGYYLIRPVEYKRGKPKKNQVDEVQLTAQVMCLEEMMAADISEAYFYYNETKRREKIIINDELRHKVKELVSEMTHLFSHKHTPKVKTGPHCRSCSLNNVCLPKLMRAESVKAYMERNLNDETTS